MARHCVICGKHASVGHNVSHSERKTKRLFRPNLQKIRIKLDGKTTRELVCTGCIGANKVTRVV